MVKDLISRNTGVLILSSPQVGSLFKTYFQMLLSSNQQG